uniref:Uncharacterized protein n=1 Tax=Palpitomonas bilix TaxID=652834 RepID=A0A7S3CZY0_9EUKA|mmetsp:Transcript_16252/g.41176  ORF Transcript_16252/g.41176 Transcript_16252/m.41176 type:complete len:862 (+) Transcript_16252:103-2688(+)
MRGSGRAMAVCMLFACIYASTIISEADGREWSDTFAEDVDLVRLDDGSIAATFTFWNAKKALIHPGKDVTFDDNDAFPEPIAQIADRYLYRNFEVSLTQGRWRERWGLPVDHVRAGGGEVIVQLSREGVEKMKVEREGRRSEKGGEREGKGEGVEWRELLSPDSWRYDMGEVKMTDDEAAWKSLVDAISALLCSSLSQLSKSDVVDPHLTFVNTLRQEGDPNLMYAVLPREAVCTENLTPFVKLLPCSERSGLMSTLKSHLGFSTPFHSLTIQSRQYEVEVSEEGRTGKGGEGDNKVGMEVRGVIEEHAKELPSPPSYPLLRDGSQSGGGKVDKWWGASMLFDSGEEYSITAPPLPPPALPQLGKVAKRGCDSMIEVDGSMQCKYEEETSLSAPPLPAPTVVEEEVKQVEGEERKSLAYDGKLVHSQQGKGEKKAGKAAKRYRILELLQRFTLVLPESSVKEVADKQGNVKFSSLFGKKLSSLQCAVAKDARVRLNGGGFSSPLYLDGQEGEERKKWEESTAGKCWNVYSASKVKQPHRIRDVILPLPSQFEKRGPSPISVERFLSGMSDAKGVFNSKISNTANHTIEFTYFDILPSPIQPFFHTMKVNVNGKEIKLEEYATSLYIAPGKKSDRPASLEFSASLPPHSTLSFTLEIAKAQLHIFGFHADANYGFAVGSAIVTYFEQAPIPSSSSSSSSTSDFFCSCLLPQTRVVGDSESGEEGERREVSGCVRRVYSNGLIVHSALPDDTMPFNVITLSSTVFAIMFGSAINISIRVRGKKKGEAEESEEKEQKEEREAKEVKREKRESGEKEKRKASEEKVEKKTEEDEKEEKRQEEDKKEEGQKDIKKRGKRNGRSKEE